MDFYSKVYWPIIKINPEISRDILTYFVVDSDKKYVKIGRSKNIMKRISQIQTSNPKKLSLMCFTNKYNEKYFHNKYKYDKINLGGSEWFLYSEEMENYLRNEL